ncbi:hypothetical protein ACTVZO_39660 [Streptomyces sp. IBSNAI002]|uniref:hypothetical protein n=1 Tax=Streptomyces sp. IBSNAI002 TaxID=3457500 RepID=UPI003FD3890F
MPLPERPRVHRHTDPKPNHSRPPDLQLKGRIARLAADPRIRRSVGLTGVYWDNALAKSFFAALK